MCPLGRLEIVVAFLDQQLSIDFLGTDQIIVKRFSAYGIPYLLQEPSSSEERLSSSQVLALGAMRRPMSFLTLSGAVAYIVKRSAVSVGCLVTTSTVSVSVKVSAVRTFLLVVELVVRGLDV